MLIGGGGSYDQMADGGEDSLCSRRAGREASAAIITPRIVERDGGTALKYHRRRSPGQTPSHPTHLHHWPTTNLPPTARAFISDQPGKKCTYTETVATIVVIVVCGGTDRGAGNNGNGEGRE